MYGRKGVQAIFYKIYAAVIAVLEVNHMNVLFIEYPKCSTCQRAKKWLQAHEISFDDRHIKDERPTALELKDWAARSGLPVRKFFNTSGMVYKELGLKDKLPDMSEDEMIEVLASDGMVVKRPLIVGPDFVLVGFKEAEWDAKLG